MQMVAIELTILYAVRGVSIYSTFVYTSNSNIKKERERESQFVGIFRGRVNIRVKSTSRAALKIDMTDCFLSFHTHPSTFSPLSLADIIDGTFIQKKLKFVWRKILSSTSSSRGFSISSPSHSSGIIHGLNRADDVIRGFWSIHFRSCVPPLPTKYVLRRRTAVGYQNIFLSI